MTDADFLMIDNCIPKADQAYLEAMLLSSQFNWTYNANTNYDTNTTQLDDVPQFIHGLIRDGKPHTAFAKLPMAVAGHFGVPMQQILRAKANLMFWQKQPVIAPAHVDDANPHFVFIYYVNDSDGDTILYNDQGAIAERIAPKKGRGLLFNGATPHSATAPIANRIRMVINFNFSPPVDFEKFRARDNSGGASS